jgi:hypothetical protein
LDVYSIPRNHGRGLRRARRGHRCPQLPRPSGDDLKLGDVTESNWLIGSLCEQLDFIEAKTGGIRQLVGHGMASRLLALFFGWGWHNQKVAFSSTPDDWMLNGNDDWLRANPINPDVRRLVNNHRVIRLADALFTLLIGHARGLETLKRRFLERATKPCFIEAEIASLLVYNGCEVENRSRARCQR